MTETEARQLKNEVAFLKRKLAAIERKYAPLKDRAAIALTMRHIKTTREGYEFDEVQTWWIDDPNERASNQRALRKVMNELEADLMSRDGQMPMKERT